MRVNKKCTGYDVICLCLFLVYHEDFALVVLLRSLPVDCAGCGLSFICIHRAFCILAVLTKSRSLLTLVGFLFALVGEMALFTAVVTSD